MDQIFDQEHYKRKINTHNAKYCRSMQYIQFKCEDICSRFFTDTTKIEFSCRFHLNSNIQELETTKPIFEEQNRCYVRSNGSKKHKFNDHLRIRSA